MPLLLPVGEILPGMCLAKPFVYKGRLMIPPGRALTGSDIGVLMRQYHAQEFYIADPVLDHAADFEDDTHDREIAETVVDKIHSGIEACHKNLLVKKKLGSRMLGDLQELVQQQMRYMKDHPVSGALISPCGDKHHYLARHAGNVFFLSVLLGTTVRDYIASERLRATTHRNLNHAAAADLYPLGLGVVCMDLGMAMLDNLIGKEGPLIGRDREQIRHHPEAGVRLLPDSFSPTARMIVRTHHENFDGTGYPNGTPGDKLHVFTRIARITDAYDAGISRQAYKEARSPAAILWEMTSGPYNGFYDPLLMRMFFGLIQPFPIGSTVRLNDGRYAVVVRYNRSNPFEPRVIVAYDELRGRLPETRLEPPIDLGPTHGIHIAEFRDEDLSFIHNHPTTPPAAQQELSPLGGFHTVFQASYP